MTQKNILELARQGDTKAIASTINYLLQDKGITAKAFLKDDCLHVMLESAQVPEQQSSVVFIRKLMMKLEVEFIKSAKIYGKKTGQRSSAWLDYLTLSYKIEEQKKQTKDLKIAEQANTKEFIDLWPAWFPYPGSWFRALLLVPLAFPIAFLIVFGLGGMIVSTIINQPLSLILFTLFGLLLPTIYLSFIYRLLWFKWKKPISLTRWFKWWQGSNSIWEGLYATVVTGLSFLVIVAIITALASLSCGFSHETAEKVYGCMGGQTGRAARAIYGSIVNIWDVSGGGVVIKQEDEFAVKGWFVIWLISAAYFYQGEYLIRKIFTPQQLAKGLLLSILALWVTQVILLGHSVSSTLPKIQVSPVPITSQAQSVTPSPVTSESPALSSQPDTFRDAVNNAISATNLTQSAKSQYEWKTVVSEWEKAIALMKAVPSSSVNYAVAQKKIVEYQRNLDYAQANVVGGK